MNVHNTKRVMPDTDILAQFAEYTSSLKRSHLSGDYCDKVTE